ncbi:helix-turn-helix domain-containing protein [Brevibacillus reuszeri]|uniref:helix-turn-helix domain-containing protein n=1 Tax=Brevibacillus reuszeri TaxID=54915 RepID=UPI00366E52F7
MNFSNEIKGVLSEKNITPSELARMTGYSPQYIIEVLKGNKRWNETTISKTCMALGLEIKVTKKENSAQ